MWKTKISSTPTVKLLFRLGHGISLLPELLHSCKKTNHIADSKKSGGLLAPWVPWVWWTLWAWWPLWFWWAPWVCLKNHLIPNFVRNKSLKNPICIKKCLPSSYLCLGWDEQEKVATITTSLYRVSEPQPSPPQQSKIYANLDEKEFEGKAAGRGEHSSESFVSRKIRIECQQMDASDNLTFGNVSIDPGSDSNTQK